MIFINSIEYLYNTASEKGIAIIYESFSSTKKTFSAELNKNKVIALDKSRIENSKEEKVLLAEEIGYLETKSNTYLSKYNSRLAKMNWAKNNNKAKKYAISKTLASEDIQDALNDGCSTRYEIAEYCDVTEDFLEYAMNYYRTKGIVFISKDID